MFNKYSFFSIIFLLLFSAGLFAQTRIGIHAKGGYSNFIETNYERSIKYGNFYTKLPSYNIGVDVYLPFFKADSSDFQIVTGLNFGSYAAKNNMPALLPRRLPCQKSTSVMTLFRGGQRAGITH